MYYESYNLLSLSVRHGSVTRVVQVGDFARLYLPLAYASAGHATQYAGVVSQGVGLHTYIYK
jgi:hypothetical protein